LKKKSDTSNNRHNCNSLKITQKIPQQDTWKAHQETTENNPTGYCTHTSESTNARAQDVYVALQIPSIVTTEKL
jgi:hypothetical protein